MESFPQRWTEFVSVMCGPFHLDLTPQAAHFYPTTEILFWIITNEPLRSAAVSTSLSLRPFSLADNLHITFSKMANGEKAEWFWVSEHCCRKEDADRGKQAQQCPPQSHCYPPRVWKQIAHLSLSASLLLCFSSQECLLPDGDSSSSSLLLLLGFYFGFSPQCSNQSDFQGTNALWGAAHLFIYTVHWIHTWELLLITESVYSALHWRSLGLLLWQKLTGSCINSPPPYRLSIVLSLRDTSTVYTSFTLVFHLHFSSCACVKYLKRMIRVSVRALMRKVSTCLLFNVL